MSNFKSRDKPIQNLKTGFVVGGLTNETTASHGKGRSSEESRMSTWTPLRPYVLWYVVFLYGKVLAEFRSSASIPAKIDMLKKHQTRVSQNTRTSCSTQTLKLYMGLV